MEKGDRAKVYGLTNGGMTVFEGNVTIRGIMQKGAQGDSWLCVVHFDGDDPSETHNRWVFPHNVYSF